MPPAGYFIDTNLPVLLVAGSEDRQLIAGHRRLREYTADDYDRLLGIIASVERVLVTPNTLTEASNLLAYHQYGRGRSRLYERLRWLIDASEEITVRSADASSNSSYTRLGLTDAALLEVATADTPVLTADFGLYLAALEKDPFSALNFDHYRDL